MTYELLSEKLKGVFEEARDPENRILNRWVAGDPRNPGMERTLANGLFDEEAIIETVRAMLEEALCVFLVFPSSLLALDKTHKEAVRAGNDYLRYALTEQRERLRGILKKIGIADDGPSSLAGREKQLRNFVRGIKRLIQQIRHLKIKEKDDIDECILKPAGSVILKRAERRLKSVSKKTPSGKIDAVIHEIVLDECVQEVNKWQTQIIELIEEVLDRIEDYDELEQIFMAGRRVDAILNRTKRRLQELGATNGEQQQTTAPLTQYAPAGAPKPPKRKTLRENGGADEDQQQDEEIAKPFDFLEISIEKLRFLIAAVGSTNQIRILVPCVNGKMEIAETFMRQWEYLLRKLGFVGQVTAVSYQDLAKTADVQTPILVPRRMNTHSNIGWKKDRFPNLAVIDVDRPKLLANHLNETPPTPDV